MYLEVIHCREILDLGITSQHTLKAPHLDPTVDYVDFRLRQPTLTQIVLQIHYFKRPMRMQTRSPIMLNSTTMMHFKRNGDFQSFNSL